LAVEISKAVGMKVDERVLDIRQLEVDEDVLIRRNLKVLGREEVYLTEIHYADLEIRGAKALIVPPSGANALVIRDAGDTLDRVKFLEDGRVITGTTTVAKFDDVGGYLEISRGKLTGALNANSQTIHTIDRARWKDIELWEWVTQHMVFRPKTSNEETRLFLCPRGSPTDLRAQLVVWNTDVVADSVNTESVFLTTRINEYILGIAQTGTGLLRPLIFEMGGVEVARLSTDKYFELSKGKLTGSLACQDKALLWGPLGAEDVNLYRPTADILRTDDTFRAARLQSKGAARPYVDIWEYVRGFSAKASATNPLRNSPPFEMYAAYYDGVTSVDRLGLIIHRMLSTVPESELAFQIAGADYACLGDEGFKLYKEPIIPAEINLLGRSFAGTAKTVTETTLTLKDECVPSGNKRVLYPLSIVIDASNPTGSGVTLYVEVRLLHSDGTETLVDSFSVAEGTTPTKDYTSEVIAKALAEGVSVTGIRLYAYCSATPTTGYEPTVTLTSVKAFQF